MAVVKNAALDDRTSLLDELRLDRGEIPQKSGTGKLVGWVLVLLLLAAAGCAAWYLRGAHSVVPVRVAIAVTPNPGAGATAGPSILDATGYIVARRQATVSAKTTGRIIELLVEEGQRVSEGQVIARLDDSNTLAAQQQASAQLEQAQANLESSQVAANDALPIYARNQQLRSDGLISNELYDNSKAAYDAANAALNVARRSRDVAEASLSVAQQSQKDTVIRAPFSGVVTVKAAQPGDMVSPISAGGGFTRTGICTIVDMDSLELEVDVSENFIHRVVPGHPAVINLNAYPDWNIPATPIAVIPTADRAKATVKVRVGFKTKDPRILPEMGARVSFLGPAMAKGDTTSGVVVPVDAVQVNGDTGVVFVADTDVLERREVQLAGHNAKGVFVLSGLAPGSRVVVGDRSKLTDKMRVKAEL